MSISKWSTAQGANSDIPTAGRFAKISGGTFTQYSDGGVTYDVHTFTSSGTLTVTESGVVDACIVAGGAAGGCSYDASAFNFGGGGGGGVIEQSGVFLEPGTYAIVVGAGGAIKDVEGGGDSSFDQFTAVGGGLGGSRLTNRAFTQARLGGSGGGGTGYTDAVALEGSFTAGAIGTAGQGNDGGNGQTGGGAASGAGGGGGAAAVGSDGTSSVGGAGGAGVASSLRTGSAVYYGGGGGGARSSGSPGAGGIGGGGAGGTTGGVAGTVNTGGGGGGTYSNNTSAAGGSGLVIVRTIATNANAGVVASGGTETTYTGDGSNGVNGQAYKVHTFTSDGTFSVSTGGNVDALLVGGGGAGGSGQGAGGGAGGMLNITNGYLSAGAHSVVVGSGGLAQQIVTDFAGQTGNNGIASSLGSYFSPGGGGGAVGVRNTAGVFAAQAGMNGGSGSGAGSSDSVSFGAAGGAGISGLGFGGGLTPNASYGASGGGGGSGAVGADSISTAGGAGGAGSSSSITGSAVTLAGGGGGSGISTAGAGGTGGGGAGSATTPGTAGTANTGSGGGGAYTFANTTGVGGDGGSGVVIIRYAV